MNSFLRKLFTAFALLLLPVAATAQFTYTTNGSGITITGYTGSDGTMVIPGSIGDYPVTAIGNGAFGASPYLTNITIPSSVLSIGGGALWTPVLATINVDAGNPIYSSADGILFNKSQTEVLQCPRARLGSYAIPNGVTMIGGDAFQWCNLSSVMIPNSVTSIGDFAFWNSHLTDVTIPDSVTNIGWEAFTECNSLTNVTIGSSVTSIGDSAFAELMAFPLASIHFHGNAPLIGPNTFRDDRNAIIYYWPGATGWGATFGGRPTVVEFGCTTNNGTIEISRYNGPGGAVILPATVAGIPVTSIASGTFFYCTSITSIAIPNSITNIGEAAFMHCEGLTGVAIPDGATSIPRSAFAACYNLAAVTIGTNATSIGTNAFCVTALTNVTIPDSVLTIGASAFQACTELTTVTIGRGVTNIDDYAFSYGIYPAKLAGVYFRGNAPYLGGSSVFNGDTSATIYYLPGTTGWGPSFAGLATALWLPQMRFDGPRCGTGTNAFGFSIAWTSGQTVVVEACTNLASPAWCPVGTNTFVDASVCFSDSAWTNYPSRLYRTRWP